jgi:hypothetical protein
MGGNSTGSAVIHHTYTLVFGDNCPGDCWFCGKADDVPLSGEAWLGTYNSNTFQASFPVLPYYLTLNGTIQGGVITGELSCWALLRNADGSAAEITSAITLTRVDTTGGSRADRGRGAAVKAFPRP